MLSLPLFCILATVSTIIAQFSNPPDPGFKSRGVFRIGETQKITYKTTTPPPYCIMLWQQSWVAASAKIGPIIYDSDINGVSNSFDWKVQIGSLDLDNSNQFFLWLFEGNSSVQNDGVVRSRMPSSFFNVTDKAAPVPSSSPSSSSTTPIASTTQQPNSTPINPSQGTDTTAPKSGEQQGLSVGASAGLGAGVGLGVLGIGCCILGFFLYKRRKGKHQTSSTHYNETKAFSRNPYAPFDETTDPNIVAHIHNSINNKPVEAALTTRAELG